MRGDGVDASLAALRDYGGSVIWYDNLREQVADSDAVVTGRFVSVRAAGEDPASGPDFHYMQVEVLIDSVLHRSGYGAVSEGASILIEMPVPEPMSVDDAARSLAPDVSGIHFLFNSARLSERLGDTTRRDPAVWQYQTESSIILQADGGQLASNGLPEGVDPKATYSSLLGDIRMLSRELGSSPQPAAVIGLDG